MHEEMLQYAESMRNTVMQCKRAGYGPEEYAYYLDRMMHYSQSAIDRKLGRSRQLNNTEEWLND